MPEKNRGHTPKRLHLKSFLDIKEWRKIQQNLYSVTHIAIRTLDSEGNLLTPPTGTPRLCSELLKKSQVKNNFCRNCLPAFLGGKQQVDKNLKYTCEAKLHNFITPIRLPNERVTGYVALGPVILIMRKPKEEYISTAERLNLETEDFWDALLEIKVVSFHEIQCLVELIKDIGEYTIAMVYYNLIRQKEIREKFDLSKLDRLLYALLDVAFEVSRADIGSVMFFDKDQKNMTIRASKGLTDDIVENTKVKSGEGIAGLAAKREHTFLIDDNTPEDKILRPYLKRTEINSSMVIPIKVQRRVWGVMNLGALRTSSVRFNYNNIRLLKRLIDLATTALHE